MLSCRWLDSHSANEQCENGCDIKQLESDGLTKANAQLDAQSQNPEAGPDVDTIEASVSRAEASTRMREEGMFQGQSGGVQRGTSEVSNSPDASSERLATFSSALGIACKPLVTTLDPDLDAEWPANRGEDFTVLTGDSDADTSEFPSTVTVVSVVASDRVESAVETLDQLGGLDSGATEHSGAEFKDTTTAAAPTTTTVALDDREISAHDNGNFAHGSQDFPLSVASELGLVSSLAGK